MARAGHARGRGLGRRAPGSNDFHHLQAPWSSFAEYSFDIDHAPVDLDWETGRPAPENNLYLRGPPPPEDFVTHHAAASWRRGSPRDALARALFNGIAIIAAGFPKQGLPERAVAIAASILPV